jgi:xanthine dehydrogenase molybdenum-binding subunit
MADYKLIGKDYQTPDIVAKVTGRAKYAEDFRAEGMVFVKIMGSPRPHARIRNLDASEALKMPGVHAILTADDLPPPPPPGAPGAAGAAGRGEGRGGPGEGRGATPGAAGAPAAPATAPAAPTAQGAPNTPGTAQAPPAQQQTSPQGQARGAGQPAASGAAPPGTAGAGAAAPPAGPPLPQEFALTKEPLYEGEPILAVAADSEELAAAAIEKIVLDLEPLDFVIDPLDSLRPGGPNGRAEGNVFVGPSARTLKWTAADFDQVAQGKFPWGAEAAETQGIGDVDAALKAADLVIENTWHQQTTPHAPLESRTAMAYWRNNKLYLHGSTQSVAQTVPNIARWVGIPPTQVVLVSEYTGGGFGSKIPGTQTMAIPALLSKKLNGRPVMMRISREEETYIGRTRPGFQGAIKMGFRKDGKCTVIDAFIVEAAGPYRRQGDHQNSVNIASLVYQPEAVRFRGVSVATNTPPGVSQRAPGGLQSSVMFEPMLDQAARKLGIDEVEIRTINAPVTGSKFGLNARQPATVTSCFLKEALDRGRVAFNWDERRKRAGQRRGTKVRGVAVGTGAFTAGSIGFDGLLVIKPDGKVHIHTGVGNLGTHSVFDTARVVPEFLGCAWEDCEVTWGDTGKGVAWSSSQAGSQTTHAHTRAHHAAAMDAVAKLQELAAVEKGGKPESYKVANGRVSGPGGSLTFAQAAEAAIKHGGKFDGHELPENINVMTRGAATALAGQGLMGVARDSYPRQGSTYSFVTGFAEIEVDVETGEYHIVDYLAVADVGIVLHPRALGGQIHGGAVQGFGHVRSQRLVYDPHYGTALATRMYHNKPPTILDIPVEMKWEALNIPDPQTPVGAKGVGEPCIGAGAAALICALQSAVGDDVIRRTPVSPEMIVTSLQAKRVAYDPFKAFI